jgi:general secretion pathway protein A
VYDSYFGLTELPFSIAPDPRYLYLSDGHREALAHLLYGIGEGGGFLVLTGEVGTGKTTVCRALLEQLPPEVDVAMVFNPALTAVELLATVCEELHIEYPKETTSFKVLGDALYRYLLDAHARGRRTVIIIDEAQNLGREVLEQVRLLTNLETTREKLLQVILIGQPELRQLLTRPDLRQLAQRVTARYHLKPFSESESRAYIHHRLRVAGQRRPILDRRAIRAVHRHARGIPRLINTICDRALLGAYASARPGVSAGIVRRATREVLGGPARRRRWIEVTAAAAILVVLAGAGTLFAAARLGRLPSRLPVIMGPRPAASSEAESAAPRPSPPEPPRPSLSAILAELTPSHETATAFATLYGRWQVDYQPKPGELACEHARKVGLRCVFRTGSWSVVRRLNLPAILTLTAAGGNIRPAVLTMLGDDTATLEIAGRTLTLPLREIERAWDGAFVALWRPPSLTAAALAPGARDRGVPWLRERLAAADGQPAPLRASDLYDDDLKRQVIAFQRAQQLAPDGIVGEETMLRLSAVTRETTTPSLATESR